MSDKATIGSAVLNRLHRLGVRHIFGIPGDYVLSLYQLIEASPIKHIGPATKPILVIHSDDDRSVPIQQAVDFAAALEQAGVHHRFVHLTDAGHMSVTPQVIEETLRFISEVEGDNQQ